ncbi:hypothetical protein [Runella sp.]|uniref:hypothetical protein n=1 Tax=Runella sp. TaxID=1960881 RepID=UPI003D10C00B
MKTITKRRIESPKDTQIFINRLINENQKHSFFEQKAEKANKTLKRVGLPKELTK